MLEEAPVAGLIAVGLPRTHRDFLPLLLAVSRQGAPFVLLSTDLADKVPLRVLPSFLQPTFMNSQTQLFFSCTVYISIETRGCLFVCLFPVNI